MREVDFLLESLVLLVGLYIQALITVFGYFLLEVLDGRLVLALGSFVGLYSRLGPFQDGLCARQLCRERPREFGSAIADYELRRQRGRASETEQFKQMNMAGHHK